jgi:hypothetical protein
MMADTWVVECADVGDPNYYGPFATYEAAGAWADAKGIEGAMLLRIEPPEDYPSSDC